MEDLLIALIQGIFEVLGVLCEVDELLKLVLKAIYYLGQWVYTEWPTTEEGWRASWIGFFYLVLGIAAGAVSVHFCHDVFFRRSATRLTLFFISPFLAGMSSWIVARLRTAFGQLLVPCYYFWWALLFNAGLCVVRFGFCHRPEM